MVMLEKYYIIEHGYVGEELYTCAWLCWRSNLLLSILILEKYYIPMHGDVGEVIYYRAF